MRIHFDERPNHALQRVQRQGLGRLLLCAVVCRFLERGVTSMLLFGEASNPSNGFYEAFGANDSTVTRVSFTAVTAGATWPRSWSGAAADA